jgi:ABC-type nitrate/sulfonate/bicarbonate transport system substrate-binding protein
MTPVSRRSFVVATLGAPMIATRARAADALKPVTFTLPWIAEGSNAYAFVAKAKGFWSQRGLDVQITRGYGSTTAAQAVGAGKFQFGLAAGPAGIQTSAKGLPVTALHSAGYDATMGICVLKDSPVKTPKDLEGRKLASTVTSGDYPFLHVFAERAKFDFSKVTHIQADPNVRQRLLVSKEVDAVSGFAITFVPPFESQHVETRNMLFSSYGLTLYNNTLITQPQTLAQDPKLCEAMAAGLGDAIRFTLLNPEEATQIFLKQVPEVALTATGAVATRLGIGIFLISMLHKPLQDNGLGYSVPDDYRSMTDLVMGYVADKATDKRPEQPALFTNQFAGRIKLSPDEWKKAMANAEPYRKYVS